MHKSFYKFDCEPFDLPPDLMFLWIGEKYKEALSLLRYGIIDNKGFLLLSGEAGIGKTILLRALTESLSPDILWAFIPNPDVPKMEMFNIIGKSFGMPQEYSSKVEFMLDFGTFLQERHQEGKKMLLIVDSAQLLSQENLEELRLLSNIETADTKLIHIFFSAQPSFGSVLTLPRNAAIRQRLGLTHTIEPLTVQETTAYIEHRLRVAGVESHILTEKAIRSVHHFSGGIPKKINLICQQVLIEGAQQGRKVIDQSAVQECMQKFSRAKSTNTNRLDFPAGAMHDRDSEEKSSNPRRMLTPRFGALVLLAIIVCAGYFFWSQWNQKAETITQPTSAASVTQPPMAPAAVSPDTTEQTAPLASTTGTVAEKSATETTLPKANPPAPATAADTPTDTSDHTVTNSMAPSNVEPPDSTDAKKAATVATVVISPDTGLATVQSAAGTVEQKQMTEAAPAPAPVATPSSAAASGDQRATDREQRTSNGDEIIIDPHQGEASTPAPPVIKPQETPEQTVPPPPQASMNAPPPASKKSLPKFKAVLPLRAGSTSLTNEGNALFASFVDKFKKAGRQGKIEVSGYVSSNSDSRTNIQLSLHRAKAVRTMLIHAGVEPSSIVVRGMGIQNPVASNNTEEGREKNRRVEMKMIP